MSRSNDILSEEKSYSNLEETQVDENAEVLPADLSGDENMERSTFPTYIKRTVTIKTSTSFFTFRLLPDRRDHNEDSPRARRAVSTLHNQ